MTCGVWFREGDLWKKKPRVEQRRAIREGAHGVMMLLKKSMCQKHVNTRKHLAVSQNVLQKLGSSIFKKREKKRISEI